MSGKPFDASLKELIEMDAPAWAALAGAAGVAVRVVDADVSTVTAAADKVLHVDGPAGAYLIDLEPVSGHAGGAAEALHFYGAALERRHELPVQSVLVLLRREANARDVTGVLEQRLPGAATPYRTFRYDVIRLWQVPLAPLLAGGLGTLPLAGLTDEAAADLDSTVRRVTQRIQAEASGERAGQLQAATFILLGLRYQDAVIEQLYQGVKAMEESSTYQLIIRRGYAQGVNEGRKEGRSEGHKEGLKEGRTEGLKEGRTEGRLEEARAGLLRLGKVRFGRSADEATVKAIEAVTDLARLEALLERLLAATTWEELLAAP